MCNLTDKFYFFTPMPNTSLSSSCRNVVITTLSPLPALYVLSSCRKGITLYCLSGGKG